MAEIAEEESRCSMLDKSEQAQVSYWLLPRGQVERMGTEAVRHWAGADFVLVNAGILLAQKLAMYEGILKLFPSMISHCKCAFLNDCCRSLEAG